ncbi:MAG: tetratricopeptide repeat protein, partial [Myxococcota bacterium]|nr:tetratricopeptide repeat protein [Myxococcota bacterium]
AEVWGTLGDAYFDVDRVHEAEHAFITAVALDPEETTWRVRLAVLLVESYGGRRHQEAAEELERALQRRPTHSELWYRLGVVYQALGDWERSQGAFGRYAEIDPMGLHAEDVQLRLRALGRDGPDSWSPPAGHRDVVPVSEEAQGAFRLARVYRDRGEWAEAEKELQRALELAPDWPLPLNLQATVALREGRPEDALRAWRESLELDPGQGTVVLQMGEHLLKSGAQHEARDILLRAAALGRVEAHYLLADMHYRSGQLVQAQEQLQRYLETSGLGPQREQARALSATVERALRRQRAMWGGGAAGVVLLALVAWLRRRRGATLVQLVERAPEVKQDLVRCLSSIRHEVLKHNTNLLDEVARALDMEELRSVSWAAVRLFGEGDEPGVVDRFDAALAQLHRLGSSHGVHLDLRRKDPVTAPLWGAMRQLRELESDLRTPPRSIRARQRIGLRLRSISGVLNDEGHRALGRFVRQLTRLVVDQSLLEQLDRRVRAEPALADAVLPPLVLQVPLGGLGVRVDRGDLEDVVANLLRNAYRVVVEQVAPSERRVGLCLDLESDPITGLEAVRFRFRDNARQELTDAMIRGRSIERGLGLAVDLIARHDGSIHVEPEEPGGPWTKAVVVQLPLAELQEEAA